MADGFRQLDGGDRGGKPPAPPFDRARIGYRRVRLRAANDNGVVPLRRMWRHLLGVSLAAAMLLLGWLAFR